MRYFASVGGSSDESTIEQKVLASNPIMEVKIVLGFVNCQLLLCLAFVHQIRYFTNFVLFDVGNWQCQNNQKRQQQSVWKVHSNCIQSSLSYYWCRHENVLAGKIQSCFTGLFNYYLSRQLVLHSDITSNSTVLATILKF